MQLRPSFDYGYTRTPIPEPATHWPHHKIISVRSQGEFDDALHTAWRDPGYVVIALADGRYQAKSDIQGRHGGKEIIIYGADSPNGAKITGSKHRIMGQYGVSRFGLCNLDLDGLDGKTQKGLVMGSSWEKDSKAAPVERVWVSHTVIHSVGQQLLKVGLGAKIVFQDIDLVRNGFKENKTDHFEGAYLHQGGSRGGNQWVSDVVFRGLYVADVFSEAIDAKIGCISFSATDVQIERVRLKYSGAITLGIDNEAPGHNQPNRYVLDRFMVSDVKPSKFAFTQNVAAIQAGTGFEARNGLIMDAPLGIALIDQAKGLNRDAVIENVVVGMTSVEGYSRGKYNTLGKKGHLAQSPLKVNMSNVHTFDKTGTDKHNAVTNKELLGLARTVWAGEPAPAPMPEPVVTAPPVVAVPVVEQPVPAAPQAPSADLSVLVARLDALEARVDRHLKD